MLLILKMLIPKNLNRKQKDNVIYLMKEWFDFRSMDIQHRSESSEKGGTMRLGSYPCKLYPDTNAHDAYSSDSIEERHRHRYEFNNKYKKKFFQSMV